MNDDNGTAVPDQVEEVTSEVSVGEASRYKRGSIFDFRAVSFTAGLGFALMGCIIEYIYVFYDVVGPATLMRGTNPGYFFIFAGESCPLCSGRVLGYFTLNGNKAPPAAHGCMCVKSTFLSLHRKRRAQLVFEQ